MQTLLRKIGVRSARKKVEALRKALDHPDARAKLQELDGNQNLLANALYKHLFRATETARYLDKTVFSAASELSFNKSYLNVAHFQSLLAATAPKALATDEFCFLVLAFGILQPQDADAIVTAASQGNPLVEKFFQLEEEQCHLSDIPPILLEAPTSSPNSAGGRSAPPVLALEPSAPPTPDVATLMTSAPGLSANSPFSAGAALDELLPNQQTALMDLQRVLDQYAETSARVRAASLKGAWEELPGLVDYVKTIEQEGRSIHDRLARELGGEQLAWAQSPPSGPEESVARCNAVADALHHARRQQLLRFEHERLALVRQFEDVDLRVPDALAQVTSLEALHAFQKAATADLRRACALKQFLAASEPSLAVLHEYTPATRMEVYALAARHLQATLPAQVIAWLLSDPAAAEADTARAQELILTATLLLLERNEALPVGTWRLLSRLAPETWVSRLVESEISGRLVLAPNDAIDADGLLATLTPHVWRVEVPNDLRRLVQREAARSLPPQERIKALNELAKEQPNDRALLLDLLDALVTAGNCAAAFLLVVAATRAGIIDALPSAVHDVVRAVLVDAATKGTPQARDVALLLVLDPEWLVIDVDGATLVLLMSWTLGVDELYHRVRYQWPDMFARATEFRPVLVGEWLVPCLEGHDPIGADERWRATQRQARALLDAFDRELQRQTFFNKWDPAKGYMTLIKDNLRIAFSRMERGEALEPADLGPILRQGAQAGFPEIDGHRVMLAMETYMCEQRLRLEALATLRAPLGQSIRESIELDPSPLRERVAAEGRLPGNASASMRRMYAHVLEGM